MALLTEVDRFWSKVRPDPGDGCWLWTGAVCGYAPHQYGVLKRSSSRENVKAHRYSYELHYGPIEAGLSALHRCDNPRCVRPDHLFLGTQRDNMGDCSRKGRKPGLRGEAAAGAVLSEKDVLDIRRRRARGESSVRLAREFGVSTTTILRASKGLSWSHVK